MTHVWVFNGSGTGAPAAVFTTAQQGEKWIAQHRLTGMLTEYPVDVSVLDWVVQRGYFKPKPDKADDPRYVADFTSGYLQHRHFEDGAPS